MQASAHITAVILAGGLGTRLRPVVGDRPKALAEVAGRPFLCFILDRLDAAGLRRVVLCTGYLGDRIEAVFGPRYGGLDLVYSREPAPLGTAGALRRALPLMDSDPVLVMNGDSYCEIDLAGFAAWFQARGPQAALCLARTQDTGRYGRVRLAGGGRITRFDEKGEEAGAGWINAGIYLIRRALIERLPARHPLSLEREAFPAWIAAGLYGYEGGGRFLDIGVPDAYAAAAAFFAESGAATQKATQRTG